MNYEINKIEDLSNITKQMKNLKNLLNSGNLVVEAEQTFWLRFFQSPEQMHEIANNYTEEYKRQHPSSILLPEVKDDYIHIVSLKSNVQDKEESLNIRKG